MKYIYFPWIFSLYQCKRNKPCCFYVLLFGKSMYYKEKKLYNEKSLKTFVLRLLFYCCYSLILKGGGYLLSRIALQYHRRKQA